MSTVHSRPPPRELWCIVAVQCPWSVRLTLMCAWALRCLPCRHSLCGGLRDRELHFIFSK